MFWLIQKAWRTVVSVAVLLEIPVPALSTALAFFDGYKRGTLPANLIQVRSYSILIIEDGTKPDDYRRMKTNKNRRALFLAKVF